MCGVLRTIFKAETTTLTRGSLWSRNHNAALRDHIPEAERILLEAAWAECRPFLNDAKRQMKNLEGRVWLHAPSVEPRVTFQLPEPGRVNLLLRIPCPTQFPSRLEQAILRKFLGEYQFRTVGMADGDEAFQASPLPALN